MENMPRLSYAHHVQVGSGAGKDLPADTAPPMHSTVEIPSAMSPSGPNGNHVVKVGSRLQWAQYVAAATLLMSSVAYMMAPVAAGRGGKFNYSIPPVWSPENDQHYSFRAYLTDVQLWIMLTDPQPHQQAAAIVMRLGGPARDMARMITPQDFNFGGMRNGVQLDPVSYVLGAVQICFAALETRLTSTTDMLAFAWKPGESINSFLAHHDIVRLHAAVEGQFVMSVEGCALQLIHACQVAPQQLMTLL
jgi:hypothetical protein